MRRDYEGGWRDLSLDAQCSDSRIHARVCRGGESNSGPAELTRAALVIPGCRIFLYRLCSPFPDFAGRSAIYSEGLYSAPYTSMCASCSGVLYECPALSTAFRNFWPAEISENLNCRCELSCSHGVTHSLQRFVLLHPLPTARMPNAKAWDSATVMYAIFLRRTQL